MKSTFYSHGKLLLSGEYLVLDGALALGLPTRLGQWMEVVPAKGHGLEWISLDADGNPWLEAHYSPEELLGPNQFATLPDGSHARLLFILQQLKTLNPGFLNDVLPARVVTRLEFPRQWGLGSSSTLLNNLSRWAGVDPFLLSHRTLGGSGYDLACAESEGPIYYRRSESGPPEIRRAPFKPAFRNSLYFLYLGQKQDSREGIALYRQRQHGISEAVKAVSRITEQMVSATDLVAFQEAMDRSEQLISGVLGLPRVQAHFPDFDGSIKSLGAWGGDFALVAGGSDPARYFSDKGYTTLIPYQEMILG